MSPKKFPVCGATLNDGSDCRTIVVDPSSDDPLERAYCKHHCDQRRDTYPEAVEAAPGEPPLAVPDVDPDDAELCASLPAPVDSGARRGSPREELRKLAEASTEQLGRFFQDALNAEQKVWTDCPNCKKRSLVPVPAWPARTRAVELLLEQGFGKPDAAPSSAERDEAELEAAVERALEQMSNGRLQELSALDENERRFFDLPTEQQRRLMSISDDELAVLDEQRRQRRQIKDRERRGGRYSSTVTRNEAA